jgi:hypothetical protein
VRRRGICRAARTAKAPWPDAARRAKQGIASTLVDLAKSQTPRRGSIERHRIRPSVVVPRPPPQHPHPFMATASTDHSLPDRPARGGVRSSPAPEVQA